jgi:hypothetical protein
MQITVLQCVLQMIHQRQMEHTDLLMVVELRGSNSAAYATSSMRIQVGYPANNEAFDQSHVNFSLQGDLA